MEAAVEKRFRRIEAIILESAERSNARMDRAELRMDKFDKQLEATRELGKAVARAHLMARIASNRADASKL